jgi:pantoate--beta-alanine ligase
LEIATTVAEVREIRAVLARRRWAALQRRPIVGLVPTMGALHEGHAALLSAMVQETDVRIASIFVNPRQFNDSADLERYPRPLKDDLAVCRAAGVDIVFTPSVDEMYPRGFETTVQAGPLGARWEGEQRPGHFDGVLTVILKLFNIIENDVAYFGEKDFQQLRLVERMVFDFDKEVHILAVHTAREPDGLALSSRNARLTAEQRRYTPHIYRALQAAQSAFGLGEPDAQILLAVAGRELEGWTAEGFTVDYMQIVDPETLQPRETAQHGDRLLFAGRLGEVRLIDNIMLEEDVSEL